MGRPRRFDQLARKIRSRIAKGVLAPGSKLDSIRNIAQREKYSLATVAKAIDLLVSEGFLRTEGRKGVYVCGEPTLQLPGKSIGITIRNLTFDESQRHLGGLRTVEQEASRAGVQVSLHRYLWNKPPKGEPRYVPATNLERLRLDGLVAAAIYDLEYLRTFTRLQIPVVAYDVDASLFRIDSVFLDNVQAAFSLTQWLFERGHSEVAYVGGPLPPLKQDVLSQFDPSALQRAEGYRLATQVTGKEPLCRHTALRHGWSMQKEARALLAQHPGVTALLCERPITVEMDGVEVACFGARPTHWDALPPCVVAVAEGDFHAMGLSTWETLRARLQDPQRPVQSVRIPCQIQERERSS